MTLALAPLVGRYQEEFAIRNPTANWFRRLALPLLLGLALAGLWSAYWLYAKAQIQDEIEREIAILEARGGEFQCADRQWGGFPLRITLTCEGTLLAAPDGHLIETARLEAAGDVHDLRNIVTTVAGPSRVRLGTGETVAIEHTPARIELFTPAEGRPQVSLAVERITVQSDDRNWSFRGRNIAVATGASTPEQVEFSASGEEFSLAGTVTPAIRLEAMEVAGRIDGLPHPLPGDMTGLLTEAARVGSRVTVETFKMQMAGIQFTASGTVELAPEGPTGTIATTVSNYREFLNDLEQRGIISRRAVRASTAVIGLLQGGRGREGEVNVALRFHEGQVFWGPFLLAEIPPLQ